MKRIYCLDKLGWPVVCIKGRPVLNLFRKLIHTRRITFKRPECLGPIELKRKEKDGLRTLS
jgi:hypothetical protein